MMRKIFIYLFIVCPFIFISCDGEETNDVSLVTNYATVEIIGEFTTVINAGESYTDPGATSEISGSPAEYTTSGSVDSNTPGVYTITYETINADGFPASARRVVVVLDPAPSAYDLSGNWARTNGSPAEVVQISDREYTHSNAGGVEGENQLMVTFYNVDDELLYIPFHPSASESGISVESLDGNIEDNDNFTWNLNASTFYGTFTRVFERQ
ncbi:immunoglobulin-like domain-containing protein [Kriegella aquimaris]|uniref:Pesticidal crystal protein Cry22Aa Ig-like domain-containing protein n=1 Tax=Kriegella aquimaris TaxID=192904 RepID=A0A1G9VUV7_9FLAO|nr:immunoglobulin-like domain-containing protein [Kriegella aquimaris]SDM75943.1 protein of unknown function [Kriegella aquimaris]